MRRNETAGMHRTDRKIEPEREIDTPEPESNSLLRASNEQFPGHFALPTIFEFPVISIGKRV